jgi:lambda repressor-like predicted transcriptional regulator
MRRVREKNIPLVVAMLANRHSLRSLTPLAGVSYDTLSRIINRRIDDPRPETKAKIAHALGVPVAQIFGEVRQ